MMDVVFEVSGRTHTVPEPQAIILAENLRLLAKSEVSDAPHAQLEADDDWRIAASELADSIEEALVARESKPLPLEGGAAEATYSVLRLMVGMDVPIPPSRTRGLRNALGLPVNFSRRAAPPADRADRGALSEPQRFLTAPELIELLIVLFALAVVTVIAALGAGIVSWYVVAPVIAALLGVRVATTRVKGKIAWSLASVVWWAIFLIPAALLVLVVGLLIVAVVK